MIRSLRFLWLFAWLRWRLLAGALRASARRGWLESLSAVGAVLAPFLLGLLMLVGAAALGTLAFRGGHVLASGDVKLREVTILLLRVVGAAGFALLALMPAFRATQESIGKGVAINLTRLLLLPISTRHLHACEVAAYVADPWILVVTPALLAVPAGAAAGGAPAEVVAVMAAAAVLLLAALVAFSALVGTVVQLLLRDRRRAERLIVFAMAALVAVSVVPMGLERLSRGGDREGSDAAAPGALAPPPTAADHPEFLEGVPGQHETFPAWLQLLPSEAHARALAVGTASRPGSAALSLLPLFVFVVGCHGLSWWAWQRLIGSPETFSSRAKLDLERWRVPGFLPGIDGPVAAVAFATVRGFLRTVRGKLAIVLAPLSLGLIGVVVDDMRRIVLPGGIPAEPGGGLFAFGAVGFAVLSLQPVLMNAFATDRAGLTLALLCPATDRQLVWGKALGGLGLAAVTAVPCLAVTVLLGPGVIATWPAAILGGLAAYWLIAPVGTWLSVLLPKHADLSSLGHAGNPHQLAGFVGVLAIGLAFGSSVTVHLLGQFLGGSWGALGLQLLWVVLTSLVAWPLLDAAASALHLRRENLALVAQGR